jgi:hypothetical protein
MTAERDLGDVVFDVACLTFVLGKEKHWKPHDPKGIEGSMDSTEGMCTYGLPLSNVYSTRGKLEVTHGNSGTVGRALNFRLEPLGLVPVSIPYQSHGPE